MGKPSDNAENLGKPQVPKAFSETTDQNKNIPKTERLAIVSKRLVILGILSTVLFFALLIAECYILPVSSSGILASFLGFLTTIILGLVVLFFTTSLVLGIIALFVIHFSVKQLKGSGYAIAGVILCIV